MTVDRARSPLGIFSQPPLTIRFTDLWQQTGGILWPVFEEAVYGVPNIVEGALGSAQGLQEFLRVAFQRPAGERGVHEI